MATTRPPLWRPRALWLALAFALVVAGAGGPWPASGIAAAALALLVIIVLGGSWVLAPWSRTARRIVLPDPDTFDRQIARLRRVANGIGRIPVLGYVWRWAQRISQSTVDRAIAEQRAVAERYYGQSGTNEQRQAP
jgi:hypothetical protein